MIMTHEPAITRITIFFAFHVTVLGRISLMAVIFFSNLPFSQPHVHLGSRRGTGAYPSSQSKRYKVHSGQVDCPLQ